MLQSHTAFSENVDASFRQLDNYLRQNVSRINALLAETASAVSTAGLGTRLDVLSARVDTVGNESDLKVENLGKDVARNREQSQRNMNSMNILHGMISRNAQKHEILKLVVDSHGANFSRVEILHGRDIGSINRTIMAHYTALVAVNRSMHLAQGASDAHATAQRKIMVKNFDILNQQTQGEIASLHGSTRANISIAMGILRAEIKAADDVQDRFQRGNYSSIMQTLRAHSDRIAGHGNVSRNEQTIFRNSLDSHASHLRQVEGSVENLNASLRSMIGKATLELSLAENRTQSNAQEFSAYMASAFHNVRNNITRLDSTVQSKHVILKSDLSTLSDRVATAEKGLVAAGLGQKLLANTTFVLEKVDAVQMRSIEALWAALYRQTNATSDMLVRTKDNHTVLKSLFNQLHAYTNLLHNNVKENQENYSASVMQQHAQSQRIDSVVAALDSNATTLSDLSLQIHSILNHSAALDKRVVTLQLNHDAHDTRLSEGAKDLDLHRDVASANHSSLVAKVSAAKFISLGMFGAVSRNFTMIDEAFAQQSELLFQTRVELTSQTTYLNESTQHALALVDNRSRFEQIMLWNYAYELDRTFTQNVTDAISHVQANFSRVERIIASLSLSAASARSIESLRFAETKTNFSRNEYSLGVLKGQLETQRASQNQSLAAGLEKTARAMNIMDEHLKNVIETVNTSLFAITSSARDATEHRLNALAATVFANSSRQEQETELQLAEMRENITAGSVAAADLRKQLATNISTLFDISTTAQFERTKAANDRSEFRGNVTGAIAGIQINVSSLRLDHAALQNQNALRHAQIEANVSSTAKYVRELEDTSNRMQKAMDMAFFNVSILRGLDFLETKKNLNSTRNSILLNALRIQNTTRRLNSEEVKVLALINQNQMIARQIELLNLTSHRAHDAFSKIDGRTETRLDTLAFNLTAQKAVNQRNHSKLRGLISLMATGTAQSQSALKNSITLANHSLVNLETELRVAVQHNVRLQAAVSNLSVQAHSARETLRSQIGSNFTTVSVQIHELQNSNRRHDQRLDAASSSFFSLNASAAILQHDLENLAKLSESNYSLHALRFARTENSIITNAQQLVSTNASLSARIQNAHASFVARLGALSDLQDANLIASNSHTKMMFDSSRTNVSAVSVSLELIKSELEELNSGANGLENVNFRLLSHGSDIVNLKEAKTTQAQDIAGLQAQATSHYAEARLNASRLFTLDEDRRIYANGLRDTVEKSRLNHSVTQMKITDLNARLRTKASINDVADTNNKLQSVTKNASQLASRVATEEHQTRVVLGYIGEVKSAIASVEDDLRQNASRLDLAVQKLQDVDTTTSHTITALNELLESKSEDIRKNNQSSTQEYVTARRQWFDFVMYLITFDIILTDLFLLKIL